MKAYEDAGVNIFEYSFLALYAADEEVIEPTILSVKNIYA
jgi:hypothetical protein